MLFWYVCMLSNFMVCLLSCFLLWLIAREGVQIFSISKTDKPQTMTRNTTTNKPWHSNTTNEPWQETKQHTTKSRNTTTHKIWIPTYGENKSAQVDWTIRQLGRLMIFYIAPAPAPPNYFHVICIAAHSVRSNPKSDHQYFIIPISTVCLWPPAGKSSSDSPGSFTAAADSLPT